MIQDDFRFQIQDDLGMIQDDFRMIQDDFRFQIQDGLDDLAVVLDFRFRMIWNGLDFQILE